MGAIHDGKLVWYGHAGSRCLTEGASITPPDSKTLYPLNSLSKVFVTQIFCMLVDERKVSWTDSIEKHLPAFKPKDDARVAQATFDELFRCSAGLDNPVVPWLGPYGKVLIGADGFIDLLNDSPTRRKGKSLRNTFVYSNMAYGLAVLVIEKIEKTPFAKLVQDRILDPLRMFNTAVTVAQTNNHRASGNIAQSYAPMDDGLWKPLDIEWTNENNGPVLGMLGIRSSVEDTLIFYSALMDAYFSAASDESKSRLNLQEHSTGAFELLRGVDQNPLKGAQAMLDGAYWCFPCKCNGGEEHSLFRHVPFIRSHCPCMRISTSSYDKTRWEHPYNDSPARVDGMLDSSVADGPNYRFNGKGICGTSAVKFFPKTRSAVVALASGFTAGDAAEIACLMVYQKLFNLIPEPDILGLVKLEVDDCLARFDKLMTDVEEHRGSLQAGAKLVDYVGEYAGSGMTISVNLSDDGEALTLRFHLAEDMVLFLKPYGNDTFSYWPKDKNESWAGGWLDWDHWDVGLFSFLRDPNDSNKIEAATLQWDETGGTMHFVRPKYLTVTPQPASNTSI